MFFYRGAKQRAARYHRQHTSGNILPKICRGVSIPVRGLCTGVARPRPDPAGRLRLMFPFGTSIEDMTHDIKLLLGRTP